MDPTGTAWRPARRSASSGWKPGPLPRCPWKRRSGASAAKSSTATATTDTAKPAGAAPGSRYIGRFAPSPTGDLHLGSLYCAVASYLDARANSGAWIVRIEDLDRPREVAGAASRILGTLQSFGFEWDGEALRQSDREELYAAALRSLGERGLIFPCSCSRAQLIQEERYPGTCRERSTPRAAQTAIRLRVEPQQIQFTDRIQGSYRQDVAATVGDV